jgi:Arc/MetJ-type ribon-helix-helix transcriptional regulator
MAQFEASRQFSFRLPESLVEQIEECAASIREKGLDLTRADVVRLLLNHSLATTKCQLDLLLRTNEKDISRRRRE